MSDSDFNANALEFFNKLPTITLMEGIRPVPWNKEALSISFSFSEKGFGFGEIYIIMLNGQVFVDGESMSRELIKEIVDRISEDNRVALSEHGILIPQIIDKAILDTDNNPDNHRLFNKVRYRQCSERCTICHSIPAQ